MMALKTKVLPKTVVIITVISALIPKIVLIDPIKRYRVWLQTMQILVLNQALDKAKATNTNAIVAIIVALGSVSKTHKPLPYF